METRSDNLSSMEICRFCLTQGGTLTSLYERVRAPKNSVTLPLKILSCLSIEVFASDKMPTYICSRCKFYMDLSYEFKNMCRQADEHILQYVQNGIPLTPMTWSASLSKVFRLANKTPEVAVMKTVVEGGTTVQVTAQSESDEEDDENVYNVKIADGSDEDSKSARVKVITSTDKDEKEKAKQTKGFSSVTKLSRHVRTHAGERSYPCKYCNKSFIKGHHYTRHLRLKHRETIRTCRGPFGEADQFRCEQCEDSFGTQDELIYHSAIHATQNLTCPLCQEKFEDVDAVTSHIKTHVTGMEFMCDLCELVFTSKEKLDTHVTLAHDDEMRSESLVQDESSMEMDVEDEDDDTGINVKEEDDHMVVEIKKAEEFMLPNLQGDADDKIDNTNSEESDADASYTELSTVAATPIVRKRKPSAESTPVLLGGVTITKNIVAAKNEKTASILRKAEEIKKKVIQPANEVADKKKVENNSAGASDKSLRLLEKELQELKRQTNTRSEAVKTPAKPMETLRSRRAQIHTSTPKLRGAPVEEKKTLVATKSPAVEKKVPERRVLTKENKEPKDSKEAKANNNSVKDDKAKEAKETPKNVVKNGNSDKNNSEDGIRRSTRPSKIKDYAKMIRDRSQDSDNDDSDDADDEEYKEVEKSVEIKPKPRRASIKSAAAKQGTPNAAAPTPRKRGRPRKDKAVASKIRKEEVDEEEDDNNETNESEKDGKTKELDSLVEKENDVKATPEVVPSLLQEANKPATEQKPSPGVMVSPTTLKKIPIKALPPGVKPMPLPVNARLGGGEVCEMQIGKKVVKVQKIVMTKAEVEAMAKKGLVEMKDGTMVLKQGIKIPSADPTALKTTLVGEDAGKESPSKKATPTRCDFGEDV
ncbi:RE1-silencing transcription factor-like isoform X1 [Trichoplusia ni]|uniref:RE1-silencing transcription factor-like isoform X1 n=1 Tax=Trichoplusia ni TaxID=7111 RepID=A0A7E5VGD5_TRINI|nr:RE1-silencing transcription factor-like isoform X1 [Trichoplusia ni]